ncbi:MAG: 1-deoxy-D-xylulose-5-phosphate synthase, partial [Planctomycetes bacterium]|nr:1-deoxy-D-xylulose-5-phosphate synthase [Planctomycetota bacterium]
MKSLRLAQLTSPADLQGRTMEELESLCAEMRTGLVDKVLDSGGHLGSNLGVVELVVAMHKVFDFRRDRVVFDVSHQCYPHKILTGRWSQFSSLRQTGGLSGFCSREESPFDMLTAGHAGTSISFGLGLAEGLRGTATDDEGDPWVVSFIGDASFGAGVSFEGLNQAADRNARMLIVLNDNEWSIARSVGALARYLSRIRQSKTFHSLFERMTDIAHRLPGIGNRLDEIGEVVRHALVPGHIFEELGVNYVGPLDGHDVAGCIEAFERAKRFDGPVLLHFLTEKGRGYDPAVEHSERMHGVSPDSAAPAVAKVPRPSDKVASLDCKSYTEIFGEAMVELAAEDSRVHAITAAMVTGTGLSAFAEQYPERFHDTGITEQHAVAMVGGMATAGLRPVAAIYSTFLQRGYDQVFQEVALQKENVVFALDRGGLVGQDGATHQGVFDLAFLRTFPHMILASPRDELDLHRMLRAGVQDGGSWALRWPRGKAQPCLGPPADLRPEMKPGVAERLREGADGAVFALGAMVEIALEAAEILYRDHQISFEVWDARFCKPLDLGVIAAIVRRHSFLATVEEHALPAGFGSAVAEAVA